MAVKRKSSPPRLHVQLHQSDDDSSSSEEEQSFAQPIPSHAKTPKRTERDDDETDSDSGSDSDPDPPTQTLNLPPKCEDSSDEEDDEEQEKEEKLKSPVKEPESEPDKKLKLLDPNQSLSTKSASAIQRIWSPEDEMALLRALCEYHSRNGKLPPTKDYTSFLSGISSSIGFPVTEKQLSNKIRQMKHNYGQKIRKGPDVKISKPHEKAVFKMSAKLFEDSSKAFKSGVSVETKKNVGTENHVASSGGHANGGVANGGAANGDAVARPDFYLRSLIEGHISRQQCPSWCHTVEDMVAQMGESRLQGLEAKAKILRIDAIKLQSREEKLIAELLDTVVEGMTDD